MKEGIDVSIYQGTIDWSKVKTDFVYIKEGQGINAFDKKCLDNAVGCQTYNIPFGYYHFATLNSLSVVNDATAEAQGVLAHLKTLPKATLAFALDVETNQANLKPEEVELWIKTFIRVMNCKVILYSGCYWLNENLPTNHSLGELGLWITEYTTADIPILPNGWNSYNIWQYKCDGKIFGITNNVDLNYAKQLI